MTKGEWVSLRDHFDQRFRDHERLHATEKIAIDLAAESLTAKLAGMNEWRQTVGDLSAKFVPRETFETAMKAQVAAAQARQDRVLTVLVALMAILLPASVAIAALILAQL